MGDSGEMSIFIFGLGYVGSRLANNLVSVRDKGESQEGDGEGEGEGEGDQGPRCWGKVGGSVRNESELAAKRGTGEEEELDQRVNVVQIPFPKGTTVDDVVQVLHGYNHFLFTAPVVRGKGCDPFLGDPIIKQALIQLAQDGKVDWAGYLSTTSVYGNHDGGWVNEDTAPMPTLSRGELRVKVENSFLFETGLPMHIFRLPGIYGPGRGIISRIRKGQARCVVKKGQVFSRIHVDDIVGVLKASMNDPNPGRKYNVTDSEPEMNHIVTEYACEIMGVEPPPREDYEQVKDSMSKMSQSFFSESKRVSNERIQKELGYTLLYPTYREGLKAQIEEELANGWMIIDNAIHSPREAKAGQPVATPSTGKANELTTPAPALPKTLQKPVKKTKKPTVAVRIVSTARWIWHTFLKPWWNYSKQTFFGWAEWIYRNLRMSSSKSKTTCLLIDNGSLKPAPFQWLRIHAQNLEQELLRDIEKDKYSQKGEEQNKSSNTSTNANTNSNSNSKPINVIAVSARYSDRIDPSLLDDIPGKSLQNWLSSWENQEKRNIIVLPYFLGPSSTVTNFIPKQLQNHTEKMKQFRIAPPLVSQTDGIIAQILTDMTLDVAQKNNLQAPYSIVLVDHGSPSRQVNYIRRGLAAQMRRRLGPLMKCVIDCSMERREGPQYAFNEPLLEDVFNKGGLDSGQVILAMAFLAPGRHAGEGGDIHEILDGVKSTKPNLEIFQTQLIGEIGSNEERITQVLKSRFREARNSLF